jgi:endonuclease I
MSQAGSYTITYIAIDDSGNEATVTLVITVNESGGLTLSAYYESADGLTGEALLLELRDIVNTNITRVSYGDTRYILDDTDEDPNDPTKVLTIYDRSSVTEVWDGTTWNREHVWPNSRLGVPSVDNSDVNIASDLHNLRAAIPSINSSRSNKWYDTTTTAETYFPGDADKGDVARIILYMYMAYPGMQIVDVITVDESTNYTPEGRYMARFAILLEWHLADPVDDFERNRNEVIYGVQNNRNPFIDYPEFVEMIWGSIPTTSTNAGQYAN